MSKYRLNIAWNEYKIIYRGYYTVARRYKFYVRVARTISHRWAQLTREILFMSREHKIDIFELMCNVFSLLYTRHTNDGVFDDFPKISDHFPKLSEDSPKIVRRSHKRCPIFWKFPKISDDVPGLPKNSEDFGRRPKGVSIIPQWI